MRVVIFAPLITTIIACIFSGCMSNHTTSPSNIQFCESMLPLELRQALEEERSLNKKILLAEACGYQLIFSTNRTGEVRTMDNLYATAARRGVKSAASTEQIDKFENEHQSDLFTFATELDKSKLLSRIQHILHGRKIGPIPTVEELFEHYAYRSFTKNGISENNVSDVFFVHKNDVYVVCYDIRLWSELKRPAFSGVILDIDSVALADFSIKTPAGTQLTQQYSSELIQSVLIEYKNIFGGWRGGAVSSSSTIFPHTKDM